MFALHRVECNFNQLPTNQLPAGWTQAISTDGTEQKCKTGFVWSSTLFASTNFANYIRDPWSLTTSSENVGQGLPWAMKSTKKCTCGSTMRLKILHISTYITIYEKNFSCNLPLIWFKDV